MTSYTSVMVEFVYHNEMASHVSIESFPKPESRLTSILNSSTFSP